jgi:hypothetical protein
MGSLALNHRDINELASLWLFWRMFNLKWVIFSHPIWQ